MKHARFEECTILCPGPSLDQFDYERDVLPNGPLVAVNTAMAEVPQADIWLLHGAPLHEINKRLEEWGTSFELLHGGGSVDVWAIYDFARANNLIPARTSGRIKWRDHVRSHGFDWWVRGPVVQEYLKWLPRTDWSGVAALSASMIAVKNGAKRIRVIGADMMGQGYAGVEGGDLKWIQREDDEHRRRWKRERTAMSLAQKECPEHGVTFEVYSTLDAKLIAAEASSVVVVQEAVPVPEEVE